MMVQSKGFSTQAVHAGEDRHKPHHALTTPIVQTAVYTFRDTAAVVDYQSKKLAGRDPDQEEYGRYGNPTQQAVERKLAVLDGGEAALLFASGMCAVTTTLLTLLSASDHMVMTHDCYRRTRQFCQTFLKRLGVDVTLVPDGDYQALEAAIRPNTKLIFSESPSGLWTSALIW